MQQVLFKKPNIAELKRQGLVCVDMHLHSRYSDGMSDIKSILKTAKKRGIGIAVTDHNQVEGALKAVKEIDKEMLIIPGIETTSSEGIHTLFYFYDAKELEEFHARAIKNYYSENPFSDLKTSLAEIIEKSKDYNCCISAAHPFAPRNTGIHKFIAKKEFMNLIKKMSFIEAINGFNLHKSNEKATEWSKELGKNCTGGSDSHTVGSIGSVITSTDSCNNCEDFFDNLKKKSIVVGKEASLVPFAVRSAVKVRMWARFPGFYAKKIIRETFKRG